MKNLLLVVSMLALSISAIASEIRVASEQLSFDEDIVDAKLVINSELGRAWVEYDVGEDDGEDYFYSEKRSKVDGLVYDKKSSQIVLLNGSEKVVCATTTVRPRRIFRGTVMNIHSTGSCSFEVRKERIAVDDGYTVTMKKVDSLYLIIK